MKKSIFLINTILDYTLNYQAINNNLKKYKKISLKFLIDNLNSNNIKEQTIFYKNLLRSLNKFQNQISDLENEKNYIVLNKDIIINELHNEINGLNKQNVELIIEINSVINSNSWKITQPLRKKSAFIKKVGEDE